LSRQSLRQDREGGLDVVRKTRKLSTGARSKKAGRPPRESTTSPQSRRRRKSATAAVRKDTMIAQTERTRALWAGKPREKKR
jgi:hypothetical protein